MGPAHRLLETAAAPTLERIRQDRKKAPTQLQPLLDYLEANLFDPDLDANQLKRACGVRDNSLPIYFHHALSLPPYAYIEDCRLEVACRMLRDTDLKVWQIAQLLGYSTLQVFSRAFDRWSGLRPSVFRRRARQEMQTAEPDNSGHGVVQGNGTEAQEDNSLICLTTLRKAINGGLGKGAADDLARQLVRLYPDSFRDVVAGNGASAPQPIVAEGFAKLGAEEAWALLRDRPRQDQLDLVQKRWSFASVELFHLLVEKGIETSRRNVHEGIEVTQLALDCLDALSASLAEGELRQLEVKGFSWLANSYRLANDLVRTEEILSRAEASFDESAAPEVQWHFRFVRSTTRLTQRRLDEALNLANQLVEFTSLLKAPIFKMRCWLQRAHVFMVMGRINDAISDLWSAHEFVDQVDDRYLHASVYQAFCYCLTLEGRHQEAEEYLPIAWSLCRELGLERTFCYLEWTEGLVDQNLGKTSSAESHLQAARSGFYDHNQPYLGAMVALDLAIFYASEDRVSETLELASEVITVFDGFEVQYEALKAIQLLRNVIASKDLSLKTLQHVRSVFAKSQPSN